MNAVAQVFWRSRESQSGVLPTSDVRRICAHCGRDLTVDPDDPTAVPRAAKKREWHRWLRKLFGIGEFDDDGSHRG